MKRSYALAVFGLMLCLLAGCSRPSAVPDGSAVSSPSASGSPSVSTSSQPALSEPGSVECTDQTDQSTADVTGTVPPETAEPDFTAATQATSDTAPVTRPSVQTDPVTQPPETAPLPETTPEPASDAAFFTIIGKDGQTLANRTAVSTDGCKSVYDGLRRFCTEQNLPMESSGSGAFVYVRSLCGLAEFDNGPLSGWVYAVNGQYASVGSGGMALCAGDEIAFYYTLDLGKDVQTMLSR